MPLFDAYLMVDWSANSKPKRGRDSIWYCLWTRRSGGLQMRALENPSTRHAAIQEIRKHLIDLAAKHVRTLVGFDFPFGYPSGFASRLGLAGEPWRVIWRELERQIVDQPDNANNRFQVATELNRRLSGRTYPFWGCPIKDENKYLRARKPRPRSGDVAEYRLCDSWIKGPQPVWKLLYTGSVGSQALMGIPHLAGLRFHPRLAQASRLWPFETGLLAPRVQPGSLIYAEIYPSLIAVRPKPKETKDALQVREIGRFFAEQDPSGNLAKLFAGPQTLDAAERYRVEREEGWILGVLDRK